MRQRLAFAVVLGLVLVGCETPRQRQAVLRSTRLEFGVGDYSEDRIGKRSWEGDSQWVAVSIAPFAGLGADEPQRVVIVQPSEIGPRPK